MNSVNPPSSYFSVKTRENTTVYFNKNAVGAVEEIPASMRSQAYLKVYIDGYHFSLDMSLEDFFQLLQGDAKA